MLKWLKRKPEEIVPPVERRPSEVPVSERARDLVNLGDKMSIADDFDGAMTAYESALRLDGHLAQAWHRRGRIFLHRRELQPALACFARALELDPSLAEAWCAVGDGIIAFLKSDQEPLFIREQRVEIISEACDAFDRALKLGGDLPRAREGREICRDMLKDITAHLASPRIFSFHSGGILEKAKREVVAPFLRPGDYRRRNIPPPA